jgi:hypothetical protein
VLQSHHQVGGTEKLAWNNYFPPMSTKLGKMPYKNIIDCWISMPQLYSAHPVFLTGIIGMMQYSSPT